MANYNLGEARGKIILETDFSSLKEGQKVVNDAKRSAEEAAQSQQQAWGKVGTAATVAGAAVVAGFGVATKTAMDFEFQLSAIQAVSGATSDEMQLISDAALRIGKDTSFSASEAALAMEELMKAGVSTEDVLNGAADATVALAAAGQIELPEAATIASNALNQFKLGAEDLTEVADIMAGAANASATGVSEIGMALSFVGPTANAAGVSIGDAAQMIALFANNGIDGARAGTALRALISNLASPTAQATEALKQMGLITEEGGNQFFDASGKMKSMEEVTNLLRDAMGGMTSEQLLANGEVLVGRENLSALAAIVNTTAEDYTALGDSINSVSAADVAATRLDNMKGSMEELSGSVETLFIQVGQRLIPMLTGVVQSITEAVNWFSNLDEGTQNLILSVTGIAGGLALFAGIVIKTIQAMQTARATILAITGATALFSTAQGASVASQVASTAAMVAQKTALVATKTAMAVATAAQWAWNAALTANPIGIIIAAIAALVAGIIWFFTQTELGQQIWSGFMTWLQEAWANVSSFLTTLWEGIVSVVTTVWNGIMDVVGAVVTWFQTYVWPIIQFVIDMIVAYFTMYYNVVMFIWNGIMTVVGAVVDWFMAHVWPTIKAVIDFLVALFNFLWQTISWVWNTIWTFISTVVGEIVSFLTDVWNNFLLGWQIIWAAVSAVVMDIWNAIVGFVQPIISGLVSWITDLWEKFQLGWSILWARVQTTINTIWNAIKSFVEPIVQGIVNFIQNTWSGITSFVSTLFNNVKNAITEPIQNALDFIGGIKDKIMGFFKGAGDWLFNIGRDIINGFIKGLESMFKEVGNFFRDLTNMIPETKGPPEKDRVLLTENGKLIMQSLYNGLASEMGDVEKLLNGMNATIPASLTQEVNANFAGRNDKPPIVLNLTYNAAPGDGTQTKEDVMAMLGHATELVREEMS